MKLRVKPEAAADLKEIIEYIADDNPDAADRLVEDIRSSWRQLLEHPRSGRARDDIAAGVRHLVVRGYLSLYRVTQDEVMILRVLHGRRQITGEAVPTE